MRVVIIGAGQGLGLELVKELAGRGHAVLAGLRRDEVPEELARLMREHTDRVFCARADVTDEAQLARAAALAMDKLGELDAVVNSSGVLLDSDRVNLLHQGSIADLKATFDVNVFGAVAVVKHFYPAMRKDGTASIVTITSEGCDIGSPGSWIPQYALSKCAATKISGIMNESVSDVRFYSVHPGRMRTVMGRETWNMEPDETARELTRMLETGAIHEKGCWYMDYKGADMMPARTLQEAQQ